MNATQQDSSITSSSIFIPNWVKNKLENSGFDPSALSPPNHDSEFFYVKFPKSESIRQQVGMQSSDRIADHVRRQTRNHPFGPNQPGMGEIGESAISIVPKIVSVVKSPVRGFTTDDANEKPSASYLRERRNSKSLPSSPLASPEGSPRARRKNVQALFPAGSIAATSLVEGDENPGRMLKSSWILSGLFSQSRESGLIAAKASDNGVAAEERFEDGAERESTNRTNLNVTVEVKPSSVVDKKVYVKKRSEIRELNFMSPVSM